MKGLGFFLGNLVALLAYPSLGAAQSPAPVTFERDADAGNRGDHPLVGRNGDGLASPRLVFRAWSTLTCAVGHTA